VSETVVIESRIVQQRGKLKMYGKYYEDAGLGFCRSLFNLWSSLSSPQSRLTASTIHVKGAPLAPGFDSRVRV
jgi:hypothetical protein